MNPSNEINTICNRYTAAYLESDTSVLDEILVDDWRLIAARAEDDVDKVKRLADLGNGILKVASVEDSEVNIRIYGDAAIVTGLRRAEATYEDRDVGGLARFSHFFVRQETAWQCVSTQLTRIAENSEEAAS